MKVILNAEQIKKLIKKLADSILSEAPTSTDIAVIGVRRRGEVLAHRLSERLSELLGRNICYGALDITLYRDDLNSHQGPEQPQVRTTEIGFNVDDKVIILVDDVYGCNYRPWSAQGHQVGRAYRQARSRAADTARLCRTQG
jgi:pyrimidine operon attenuation protein/uracil phosphoribosyltransferase